MPHTTKAKAKAAELLERRVLVAQLLKARTPYRQIATALNVSLGTVASDVKAIFKEWAKTQVDSIKQQAALDLATMNDAIMALTNDVRTGDIAAINAMIRIMERRAKMLGFDAPTEITGDVTIRTLADLVKTTALEDAVDVTATAREPTAAEKKAAKAKGNGGDDNESKM